MGPVMRRVVAWLAVFAVSAAPASAAGWARADLHPVTQPAPVGGLFALFVAQDGRLSVVGLDAATGATVWSAAASTSRAAPGVSPALEVAGANVIFLAGRGTDTAALTAVDAQTGAPVWNTEPGTFNDAPGRCVDDPSAVCVSGVFGAGEPRPLRFDVATGRRLPAPRVTGPGPRELGAGIYDAGAREPEKLVAVRDGKVAWSRPLSRIFPMAGATSDYGWNFGRLDRLGLFVGSVGSTPVKRKGRDVIDLTRYAVAGFRIADGVVKWRTPGFYECFLLPCSGASQAGYTTPDETDDERVGLRLVERGTLSFSPSANDLTPRLSADANAVIEGFSPATGRALWRFDAGRNTGLISAQLIPAQTGAHTVIVTGAGGRLVALDLASGARRAVPATARGWCRKPLNYRQRFGYDVEGPAASALYVGQYAVVWCGARTQRRLAPPPQVPAFVGEIGARNAGLIAWSDTAGVIAEPPA
jgi:outer membrane protein assembly factor BamB